jgi:hypothetical protein
MAAPVMRLAAKLTPADESGSVFVPVGPPSAAAAPGVAPRAQAEPKGAGAGQASPPLAAHAPDAVARVEAALQRIASTDSQVNAFTGVLAARARARAASLRKVLAVSPRSRFAVCPSR